MFRLELLKIYTLSLAVSVINHKVNLD